MTRGTRLDRLDALIDATWGRAPPQQRLLEQVRRRFGGDRLRFGDILEWSLSARAGHVELARFSYGFPSLRAERPGVEATLLEWAAALGPGVEEVTQVFVRASRAACVEQVLMGYARGAEGEPGRTKLYLQFFPRAGEQALSLARRITGQTSPTTSDALPLHLLGLDVGDRGLVGYKLYFVQARADASGLAAWPEGLPQPVPNALLIHRGAGPDDEAAHAPSALDFALDSLPWSALPGAATGAAAFAALQRDFRLRARRLSLSLSGPASMNLYYVLDEVDPSTSLGMNGGLDRAR